MRWSPAFLLPLVLLSGCAPKTIAFAPLRLGNGEQGNTNGDDDDCGWLALHEASGGSLALHEAHGGSLVTTDLSLYYCCPGPDGKKPVCRETEWKWLNTN